MTKPSTQFVIKLGNFYYNSYLDDEKFVPDITNATKFIHADVAKQKIIDKKLGSEARVYQVNYVELEIK